MAAEPVDSPLTWSPPPTGERIPPPPGREAPPPTRAIFEAVGGGPSIISPRGPAPTRIYNEVSKSDLFSYDLLAPTAPPGYEKAIEQQKVHRIIRDKRYHAEAEWAEQEAKVRWRMISVAKEVTSPRRVSLTPRWGPSKTPAWKDGPRFADKPLHVPLPAGASHKRLEQSAFRFDAIEGAALPPSPRRHPTELPSPRQGESPKWKVIEYDHPWRWR